MEFERDPPALPGLERTLAYAASCLSGRVTSATGSREVELDDLRPSAVASVGHRRTRSPPTPSVGNSGRRQRESPRHANVGVRQPVAEREERRRVEVRHALAVAAERRQRGTCPAAPRWLRDAHGQLAARVESPDRTPAIAAPPSSPGMNAWTIAAHRPAKAPERVRATGDHDEHGRRTGLEHRLDELALDAGQREVVGVAALPGRAAPEEPGEVADGDDGTRRRRGPPRPPRRCRSGPAPSSGSPARGRRAVRQLRPERVEQGRHLDAQAELGVPRHHAVVGVGVAARGTCERVVGARPDERHARSRARSGSVPSLASSTMLSSASSAGDVPGARRVDVELAPPPSRSRRRPVRVEQPSSIFWRSTRRAARSTRDSAHRPERTASASWRRSSGCAAARRRSRPRARARRPRGVLGDAVHDLRKTIAQ